MSLKGHGGMFATHVENTMVLERARTRGFEGQHVSIHRRTLYFEEDGVRYTLAMLNDDIEVRVVNAKEVRPRVSFFSRRRPLDLFHLDTGPSEDPKQWSPPMGMAGARASKLRRLSARGNMSPEDPGESLRATMQGHSDKRPPAFLPVTPAQSFDQGPAQKSSPAQKPPAQEAPEPPSFEDPGAQKKAVLRESPVKKKPTFHIESDSSVDEGYGYAIRDVRVKELDKDYFALVAENNICVTYFKSRFVFARCNKSDQQKFRLHSTEEVKKRYMTEKAREKAKEADTEDVYVHEKLSEEVPRAVKAHRNAPAHQERPRPEAWNTPKKARESLGTSSFKPFVREKGRSPSRAKAKKLAPISSSESTEHETRRDFSKDAMLMRLKRTLDATNLSDF